MNIASFFDSYLGRYIVQSIVHSLIAAIIVDRSIQAWKIDNPLIQQRFRYIIIISPIISFPIYQMINPERGSISFRLEALFDTSRWLNLELWGRFPLNWLFILILFVTALMSFSQEIIPVLKHTIESKKTALRCKRPEEDSVVNKALESLPVKRPDVFLIDDNDFILFSAMGKNTAIYLSDGLADALTVEQIQAALAHEIAHIIRSRQPLIIILFFLRILMFFNPIALIEFRNIVQEDEEICDNIAVSLTQKPHALVETLKKFYRIPEKPSAAHLKKPSRLGVVLEEYSHNMHIKKRILRLEGGLINTTDGEWSRFVIIFAVVMAINYFVV